MSVRMARLVAATGHSAPKGWCAREVLVARPQKAAAAAPIVVKASPSRLNASQPHSGLASTHSVGNVTGFFRKAVTKETAAARAHAGATHFSATRVRKESCFRPSSQPSASARKENLTELSADAIFACLQLLRAQCAADAAYKRVGAVTSARVIATRAETGKEWTKPEAIHKSSSTMRGGGTQRMTSSIVAAASADVGSGSIRSERPGPVRGEHQEQKRRRVRTEERTCVARALLRVLVQKEDISEKCILETLRAMLTFRVYAPELLTKLAITIRRRLLHTLPPDGLVGVLSAFCFFFPTLQHSSQAVVVSNCVERSAQLPAPVENLVEDLSAKICRRVGHERLEVKASEKRRGFFEAEAPDGIKDLLGDTTLAQCCRSSEVSSHRFFRTVAASEVSVGLVCRGSSTHLTVSDHDADELRLLGRTGGSKSVACGREGSSLSRAGLVTCAWALSRLPFLQKKLLAKQLEDGFRRKNFAALPSAVMSKNLTRIPPLSSDLLWKRTLRQLQDWGAIVAASAHLPEDTRIGIGQTAQNQVIEALSCLRSVLRQQVNNRILNSGHVAPAGAVPAEEQKVSSPLQAPTSLMRDIPAKNTPSNKFEKVTPMDSLKSLTQTGTSGCSLPVKDVTRLCPVCAADAATICGTVTATLRLCGRNKQDCTQVYEELKLLHEEDPFLFFLPNSEICRFLAAVQEGIAADLHTSDKLTHAAPRDCDVLPHCSHAIPSSDHSQHMTHKQRGAFLYWPLLFVPRIALAGERFFHAVPPHVLALLVSMLSHMPKNLASLLEQNSIARITSGITASKENPSVEDGSKALFTGWQKRIVPSVLTRDTAGAPSCFGGATQHTSFSALEDVHFGSFADFEKKLVSFSSSLCRAVLETAARFGEKDLLRAIAAARRLDSDARQLPFSGDTWVQHPNFGRVLDCLGRALRKRRQRNEERLQTFLPETDSLAAAGMTHSWPLRDQALRDNVDKFLPAKPFIAVKPEGTIPLVERRAQHDDDASSEAYASDRCRVRDISHLSFSAHEDAFARFRALRTSNHSNQSISMSHLVDEQCGGDAKAGVASLFVLAVAGEEKRTLQLVRRILQPCLSEVEVDQLSLQHLQYNTRVRKSSASQDDKSALTQARNKHTSFKWKQSPSLLFEDTLDKTGHPTSGRNQTEILQRGDGQKRDKTHRTKLPDR